MTDIHCSTCGQFLPEPQAVLAEAAIEASKRHAQAERKAIDASRERLEREDHRRLLQDTREEIRRRGNDFCIDLVWEMREAEQTRINYRRLVSWKITAKALGLTMPMARVVAEGRAS